MNSLKSFYNNTIKYDLINKFSYKNIEQLPKLKKITLNFNCRTSELKAVSSATLALQLVTKNNSNLIAAKKPNILLKIRKGNPTGCKVILKKKYIFDFFTKISVEISQKLRDLTINLTENKKINSVSFAIIDTLVFSELEKQYYLFNNLPKLYISVTTNVTKKKELVFLFNSIKFPV